MYIKQFGLEGTKAVDAQARCDEWIEKILVAAGETRHAHLVFVLCEKLIRNSERKSKLQLMTMRRSLNNSDGIARVLNVLARLLALQNKEAAHSLVILEELLEQEKEDGHETDLVEESRSCAFWLMTHYAELQGATANQLVVASLVSLHKVLESKSIVEMLSMLEQSNGELLSTQFLHGSIALDVIEEIFQEQSLDTKLTQALHQSLNSLLSLDLHLAIALRVLEKVQNNKRYYRFKAKQMSLLLDKVPWVARELSKAN